MISFASEQLLARASKDFEWDVPMEKCLQIWRAGCIIRSGYVSSVLRSMTTVRTNVLFQPQIADLIQPLYQKDPKCINLLLKQEICDELAKTYDALKEVVKIAIDTDSVVPALSASLEYIKAVSREDPTNFEEAQLDAFGDHCFSFVSDHAGAPKKGEHHVGVSYIPTLSIFIRCTG
jgi:6-phosphogluconate dehydrogenase